MATAVQEGTGGTAAGAAVAAPSARVVEVPLREWAWSGSGSPDRPSRVEASAARDRPRPEERGSTRRTRALEGPLSRGSIPSSTVRRIGGCHAGAVYDLDTNPNQPAARARDASPTPGNSGSGRRAGVVLNL